MLSEVAAPFDGVIGNHGMARIRWIGLTVAVALLYFACARMGLLLAFEGTHATPVWPPAGIALGLALLYGVRVLPGVFLGALAANIYQGYVVAGNGLVWSLSAGVGVAFGNTTETLMALALLQRFAHQSIFSSLRGVVVFLGACVAGSLLAAVIAAFTLLNASVDTSFALRFALTWWLGDLAAMVLLAPCIVSWMQRRALGWNGLHLLHLFVYASAFMLAMNLWYAPGVQAPPMVPTSFLLLPLFVWGAMAFSLREISLLLFLFGSFMLYRALESPPQTSLHDVLLDLQLKVCVVVACVLAMNAAFAERRRWRMESVNARQLTLEQHRAQMAALETHNQKLQQQLAQQVRNEKRLQEHEERLALITQATTDGIWEWEPPSLTLRYSSRFKALLGFDQFDQLPPSLRFWLRRMPAEDRACLLQNAREHLTRRAPLDCTLRMRNKAGLLHWYRVQGHATWNEKGRPVLLAGSISDVHRETINRDILLGEKRLLERMTSGATTQEVLSLAVELLKARFVEGGAAIALIDEAGVNLNLVAHRDMHRDLRQLLGALKVGPQAVSVGAAIYFNSPIIVTNIEQQAEWRPYLPLLRDVGVRSCWAFPIRNRHGSVLGSLGVNFAVSRQPDADESEFLDRVARLAGMAVEQDLIRTNLQRSEQRFRELYHHNPAMFFSLTPTGTIVSVNRFGAEHLGYEPAELVERDYADLIEPESRAELQDALRQALEAPGRVQVFEARKRCADDRLLWVRDSLRALGGDGEHVEILVVAEDITDIRELSERLSYHASHDPLTGLINRRKFEAELVNAIYEANTLQSNHALCYLDLDLFKVINDTCGHGAGDELLRQLGQLLRETVDGRGVIARLGGDEFGLLILHTDPDQVLQLAGEVRDRIAQYQFVWERRPYHVGVSIGVAMINRDTSNLTSLMSAADSACYAAKEAGRNRIQFYRDDDNMLQQRRGEMQWVTRIPRGIRENRFALAVQEIVPLSPHRLQRHVELLLRYRDKDGQWVAPQEFLPAAERYSLATMIDRWVFVQLAHLLQTQPRLLEQDVIFNVNLSGQSVTNDEFQKFLIQRITDLQLPAQRICFEITETSAITNLSHAKRFIEALRALGCQFALDDFGSGLSTFGYLKGLPVDYIKIDGQFVRDIETDEMDFAIVKSINEVGHVLGKQTIAECVESAAIARRLQSIGVDWAQGFHLGRPLMLTDWLRQQNIDYLPQALSDQL